MTDARVVVDNVEARRFELPVEGLVAFSEYQISKDSIVITHTEVPEGLQGQGIGSTLARGVLNIARERGRMVVPVCPFMASYIRSHPEQLDLVSESNRRRLRLGRDDG